MQRFIMIREDSILRQLPPGLSRKDALFIDGIRHAIEIAGLAYTRLEESLTAIAMAKASGMDSSSHKITAVYLDAWAFVDAIDRFRSLLKCFPNAKTVPRTDGDQTLAEITAPIRKLRNVADHLAQRIDYLISKKSTALGTLTWYTTPDPDKDHVLFCALIPGTIGNTIPQLVNLADKRSNSQTFDIHLEAGEYRACLSDVYTEIRRRVTQIEASLITCFEKQGWDGQAAGADLTVVITMALEEENNPSEPSGTDQQESFEH
jgi:hypothetical protein